MFIRLRSDAPHLPDAYEAGCAIAMAHAQPAAGHHFGQFQQHILLRLKHHWRVVVGALPYLRHLRRDSGP